MKQGEHSHQDFFPLFALPAVDLPAELLRQALDADALGPEQHVGRHSQDAAQGREEGYIRKRFAVLPQGGMLEALRHEDVVLSEPVHVGKDPDTTYPWRW